MSKQQRMHAYMYKGKEPVWDGADSEQLNLFIRS